MMSNFNHGLLSFAQSLTKFCHRYCGMLAAQGGHYVLLELVREACTHPKVANITDRVLSTIVEHGLLPSEEVIQHRKVFASF